MCQTQAAHGRYKGKPVQRGHVAAVPYAAMRQYGCLRECVLPQVVVRKGCRRLPTLLHYPRQEEHHMALPASAGAALRGRAVNQPHELLIFSHLIKSRKDLPGAWFASLRLDAG